MPVGPGNYDPTNASFSKQSYNKNRNGYLGGKEARFDDPIIRPNLGQGSYQNNLDIIREKKYINIKMWISIDQLIKYISNSMIFRKKDATRTS